MAKRLIETGEHQPDFGPSESFVKRLGQTKKLDSSLRDGAQDTRIRRALTIVENRLEVARTIDSIFRPDIIEGGWPGANPADTEFFQRARTELDLEHSTLAAFGMPAKPGANPYEDRGFMALLESEAPTIVFVGKGSRFQAENILRISGEANLEMIDASIRAARAEGRNVIFDAEHALDGFAGKPDFEPDPRYAMQVLQTAIEAGAETIVLCDTNGGAMPETVEKVMRYVTKDPTLNASYRRLHGKKKLSVGIHAHDDRKRAVDITFRAVQAGADHIQGTMNGGERLGNADMLAILGTMRENYGIQVVPDDILVQWKRGSEKILELSGLGPDPRRAFVGDIANATKAGLHASGSSRNEHAYSSYNSRAYGLEPRVMIGEMIGKDGVKTRLEQLGFPYEVSTTFAQELTKEVKVNVVDHHEDYIDGEGSFYLLALRKHPDYKPPFEFSVETNTKGKKTGLLVIHDSDSTNSGAEKGTANTEIIPLPKNPAEIAMVLKQRITRHYPQLIDIEMQLPDIKTDNSIPRVYTTVSKAHETHARSTNMRPGHDIPETTAYVVADALELAIHNLSKTETPSV